MERGPLIGVLKYAGEVIFEIKPRMASLAIN